MNNKWGINAGVFLTKEELSIAADLAGDQSISEYLSGVIRKHLNQPLNKGNANVCACVEPSPKKMMSGKFICQNCNLEDKTA